MANVFSPQVITREIDVSTVAPAVSTSIAALVGVATKGPVNVPQYITTPDEFVNVFGEPIADNPYLGYTALNFLRQGNQLWVNRIASTSGADGIAYANTDVGASITSNPILSFGFTQSLTLVIDGTTKIVALSPSQTTSISTIVAAINTALDGDPCLGVATITGTNQLTITSKSKDSRVSSIQCATLISNPIFFPTASAYGARTVQTAEALSAAALSSSKAGPFNTTVVNSAVRGNNVTTGTLYNVATTGQEAYGSFVVENNAFTNTGGSYASGTITFSGLPVNNDSITIDRLDGTPGAVVFQFKTTPAADTDALVQVPIGSSPAEAATNLYTAINDYVKNVTVGTPMPAAGAPHTNLYYPRCGVIATNLSGTSFSVQAIHPDAAIGNAITVAKSFATPANVTVPATLSGGVDSDYIALTVPATVTTTGIEDTATYFYLAGADFLASGTLTTIASSIAAVINNRAAYSNDAKAFVATASSNAVTLRTHSTIYNLGNGIIVDLDHNSSSSINASDLAAYTSPYTITNGGTLKHGYAARSGYLFANITVDGVTKGATDFKFDTVSISVIPDPHEATIQQICDVINDTFQLPVASPIYDGLGNERIQIASPTSGKEGNVTVDVATSGTSGADPFYGPASSYAGDGTVTTPGTAKKSVGTGDSHLQIIVDDTYTVDVYFTQSATLSAADFVKEINDAATVVSSTLSNLASADNAGIVTLTSPTKGSYLDFGSRISIPSEFRDIASALVFPASSVDGAGDKLNTITISATSPGDWANDVIEVAFTDEDELFAAQYSSKVDVYKNGVIVESFRECVLDPNADGQTGAGKDGVFIETAINGVSEYITIDFDDDLYDSNPNSFVNSVKIVPNTSRLGSLPPYVLSGGMNGIGSINDGDVIGVPVDSVTGLPTGLQVYADTEKIFINLLAAPGFTSQAVGNALVALAEGREDTLAFIDPPVGLKTQQVVDWHNGQGNGRTAALNTSYAATYNTWLTEYDPYNDQNVTLPPSAFLLAQMAYNDSVAEPWFATAGLTRGRLTQALDVMHNAGLGERELLYGQGNRINPIPKFIKEGIVVWGNSTLYRQESALREITVRRLLNYAKVVIGLGAKVILFEPNDPSTSKRLLDIINPVLYDIQVRRGLTQFKVVDATTDADRNLNRMVVRIFLQPTRTVEVIDIPFIITKQGGSFVL